MKVESMVLVSCTLRARASNSCLIKADFSCSSWAMRSLFSVTSFADKQGERVWLKPSWLRMESTDWSSDVYST